MVASMPSTKWTPSGKFTSAIHLTVIKKIQCDWILQWLKWKEEEEARNIALGHDIMYAISKLKCVDQQLLSSEVLFVNMYWNINVVNSHLLSLIYKLEGVYWFYFICNFCYFLFYLTLRHWCMTSVCSTDVMYPWTNFLIGSVLEVTELCA